MKNINFLFFKNNKGNQNKITKFRSKSSKSTKEKEKLRNKKALLVNEDEDTNDSSLYEIYKRNRGIIL